MNSDRRVRAAIALFRTRGLISSEVNRKGPTSYGWKHIIERAFHGYISNEAFIGAAERAGLKTAPARGPNVFVNLSNAAVDLLRGPCGGITDNPDVLEELCRHYVEVGR